MKARHICATLGIAAAVGAVVFMQSLVATNDRQAVAMAERMLSAVPVEAGAKSVQLQLDFRPDGRVLQGPPMIAFAAVRKGIDGALVTKALFAQRRIKNLPSVGDELTLVGRKGAYRVRIAGFVEWERPVRGYPNMFLPPSAVAEIDEDWQPFEPVTAEEAAPMFMSDAGRNMDRAKGLLLWAAALTALCLLLNSLVLSVESRRRELAVLRMVGLTRSGVARLVAKESLLLSLAGLAVGTFAALAALRVYVACDAETFPSGPAAGIPGIVACVVATPLVALFGALLALKPALSVRPLEAASGRAPRKRHLGMLVAFAFGFGAFVAVEVWGSSLTKPFIPSPEWPDAIVSILPGGVSSFDIERLRNLRGVKRIGELQPLQVNGHVGDLTLSAGGGLVDHDFRVGQRHALALGAGGQQKSAHAGGHADADGGHVALDVLHRVIDGHARGDGAAGAVDIELDVLVGVLRLQIEELRHDQGRGDVVDFLAEHHDAVIEEAGKNVVRALAAARLLNDVRD